MRLHRIAVAVVLALLVLPASAQLTLNKPLDEPTPYYRDSGVLGNVSRSFDVVHVEEVSIPNASWLRLYFGDVELDHGSFLRITSMFDGEVQELDAAALEMWSNTTAYFNGDTVTVELVAGPGTHQNRLVIEQLASETLSAIPTGGCGICGADDRVPSFEDFAARLFPAGCSATIYNTESCGVTAGHCISGGMVLQFKVPPSLGNCQTINPPITEQFPVSNFAFTNGGVGNDWGVLVMGTNNLGETPFERYGELKPIAMAPPQTGDDLTIWGYGVDSECTKSQVQQTSDGDVTSVGGTFFNHNVDATFGNSGSSVIRNGQEILGIATHCPCPNWATRVDHPNFAAARDNLCPTSPAQSASVTSIDVVVGTLDSGGVSEISSSDNAYVAVDSVTAGPRNNAVVDVFLQSPTATASELNLTVEYGVANANPVFLAVFIWNNDDSKFDSLQFGIVSTTSDTTISLPALSSPGSYVNAGGEIRVRVAQTAREPQTPGGYTMLIDEVGVTVKP